MTDQNVNLVKVFSATKAKDRESIGERVTDWIATHRDARILKTSVSLSSDANFHCLSIVMFCATISPDPEVQ
jgi:hypothetical protein